MIHQTQHVYLITLKINAGIYIPEINYIYIAQFPRDLINSFVVHLRTKNNARY